MISNIEYSLENNPKQFNDDKISFHINNSKNNIKISFVNGIRRVIEEHMTSFVLTDVNVVQNNTVFNNDILIQRLKMMPIIYSKAMNFNIDKLVAKIDILNDKEYPIAIKSKDIKFLYEDKEVENIISYPEIIFVQNILPGQTIQLMCNLHKDESRTHAAFKHTCKNLYYFKLDDELINTKIKEQNITDEKDKIDFRLSNQIYKKTDKGLPETYIYEMESNGIMSVKETLKIGLEYLIVKLGDIIELVKTDILEPSKNNPLISVITFNNETHTIGNLLSQYASEHKLLDGCTYLIPHPLDNVLLVKLHFLEEKNNTIDNCILIIKETCEKLIKLYEQFLGYF
jgi:DNA-directed RNA polymerase subunit L